MLLKLLSLGLAVLLLMAPVSALAESTDVENQIPEEAVVTDAQNVLVTAVYDAEADQTRYTIALKDDACFPDGSAVTADDLLFTWYVYLDPGYAGEITLAEQNVAGLESYRLQASEATLAAARAAMAAIGAAGPDHAWSESDGWSSELQEAYWAQRSAYEDVCKAEYPNCVQSIVDYCQEMLLADGADVFGLTAQEVADSGGLSIAYAMLTWGYAAYQDDINLVSTRTRTAWQLGTGVYPTIEDFTAELQTVYGNDLAACWAVETTGRYAPILPDWESEVLRAAVAAGDETILSASGIRVIDEKTVEILLEGIDMRAEEALLALPVLPLAVYGDASQWNPEAGQYGHAFGDVSSIESALSADSSRTIQLLEKADDEIIW